MARETSKSKGNPNDSGPGTKCEGRSANVEFGRGATFDTRNSSFAIRPAAWKLARMNLAIRGQRWPCASTPRNADSFRADLHPDLKADFVPVRKDLTNPPFNMSDWGGENLRQDVRWKFGMPPVNNANYAWIQHFLRHLSPVGVTGFVMAKTTRSAHSCSMKIAEDVRKYAAEQGIAEDEALKQGMEAKSKEFVEKGSELYAKA